MPTTKRRSRIIAHKTKQEKPGRSKYQLGGTSNRNNHTFTHPIVEEPIHFGLEARTEGVASSWEMLRQRH